MMMILCVCPSLASEKVFLAQLLCDSKDNKLMWISSSWYSLGNCFTIWGLVRLDIKYNEEWIFRFVYRFVVFLFSPHTLQRWLLIKAEAIWCTDTSWESELPTEGESALAWEPTQVTRQGILVGHLLSGSLRVIFYFHSWSLLASFSPKCAGHFGVYLFHW